MRNIVDYDKRRYGRDTYGNLYLKTRKKKIKHQFWQSIMLYERDCQNCIKLGSINCSGKDAEYDCFDSRL